jgi:hypothetical protein
MRHHQELSVEVHLHDGERHHCHVDSALSIQMRLPRRDLGGSCTTFPLVILTSLIEITLLSCKMLLDLFNISASLLRRKAHLGAKVIDERVEACTPRDTICNDALASLGMHSDSFGIVRGH